MIALRGVTKAFPAVLTNDHIDLDIISSENHALLGEIRQFCKLQDEGQSLMRAATSCCA